MAGSGDVGFVEVGVAVAIVRRVVTRLVRNIRAQGVLAKYVADFVNRTLGTDTGVDRYDHIHIDQRTAGARRQTRADRKSNARRIRER